MDPCGSFHFWHIFVKDAAAFSFRLIFGNDCISLITPDTWETLDRAQVASYIKRYINYINCGLQDHDKKYVSSVSQLV